MKRIIIALIFLTPLSYAKTITLGHTFPIIEKSLLTLIYERLGSISESQKSQIEAQWTQEVRDKTIRPDALSLSRIDKTKTHFYKPEARVLENIKDANGHTILSKGMVVNALDRLPDYFPVWIFINFDDVAQRLYTKRLLNQFPDATCILTGGSIVDAEKELNQTIYFDQQGRITEKLKIKHVPAIVLREKDALKIREILIGEDGREI
ncbi:MAG TPA: type-F conjugative transfer system protein TraW [Legionellaceae bacterium]|nr:type-F conjugative transfer system protein TraW [Legionellaceae bacterium]